MRDKLCVAVDQGTTDVKVGLVTLTGDIAWRGHAGVTTTFGPGGQATQDAAEWWTTVTDLLGEALATFDARDVTAVCCTGMWSSTVPVDRDGRPVGPASTWLDTQGAAHSRKVIAGPVAGIDRSKLPPLVPTGSVVGFARDELGLLGTTKVVAGLPDLHTAAVGAGAVAPYATHLAISTSAWISCPVPFKKTDVLHQIASLPGLRPGEYLVGNNHETAGRCLQWFRDTFLPGTPFDDVTARAATAAPGAGGVLFAPWLVGERSPVDDRNARGGFHNVSIDATIADLARAVLEGVAYNARWLHEHVERFCKQRLDPIRIFGGGAVSDLWCQIHADVLDRTIERVTEPRDCGIRGAALFAGLSLGAIEHDEVASLVRVDRTFTPEPGARAVHDRLFPELPKLYRAQRGMFRRLNRS